MARISRLSLTIFLSSTLVSLLVAPLAAENLSDSEREVAIAALGEELFSDVRLSSSGTVSCVTCHDPLNAFTDGRIASVGEKGVEVGRNAPTLRAIGEHDRFVDPLSGGIAILRSGLSITPQIHHFPVTISTEFRTVELKLFEPFAESPAPSTEEEKTDPSPSTDPPESDEPPEPNPEIVQTAEISTGSTLQIEPVFNAFNVSDDSTGPFSKKAISLAERCLSPLGNHLEMGAGIDATIRKYRAIAHSDALFDAAFGAEGGVTRERVGEALAAYLRTLKRPATAPYARYLEGETDALDPRESRGLALFTGKGACAGCHSGESLRDGLVHVSRSQNSARPHLRPAGFSGDEVQLELVVKGTGGGTGYGGLPLNVTATPTLWDVSRTGPYFGDGSVPTLESALALHVTELTQLGGQITGASVSAEVLKGKLQSQLQVLMAIDQVPESLRPRAGRDFDSWPFPETLTEAELADLLAFLRSLSPQPM